MVKKIYNCSLDKNLGYVFEESDIVLVDKATGKQVHVEFDTREILEDASKAYIKNDVYEVETLELEKEIVSNIPKVETVVEEVKDPEGVAAFNEQLNAKEFGEYLIVIGDYAEQDFNLFTGTKKDLNTYIANLHLHTTPKVYMLKQLQVATKYEVI